MSDLARKFSSSELWVWHSFAVPGKTPVDLSELIPLGFTSLTIIFFQLFLEMFFFFFQGFKHDQLSGSLVRGQRDQDGRDRC